MLSKEDSLNIYNDPAQRHVQVAELREPMDSRVEHQIVKLTLAGARTLSETSTLQFSKCRAVPGGAATSTNTAEVLPHRQGYQEYENEGGNT